MKIIQTLITVIELEVELKCIIKRTSIQYLVRCFMIYGADEQRPRGAISGADSTLAPTPPGHGSVPATASRQPQAPQLSNHPPAKFFTVQPHFPSSRITHVRPQYRLIMLRPT